MSGWLNFFEEQFTCPHCHQSSKILLVEDGTLTDPPDVTTSFALDIFMCPVCKFTFTNLSELISEEPTNDLTNNSFNNIKQ